MTEEPSERQSVAINQLIVHFYECNGGGFNVVIDNVMHGCSTLQEAFNFAAAQAQNHFSQEEFNVNLTDMPRILRRPNLWQRIKHGTLGVTTTLAFVSVLGLAWWGKGHDQEKPVVRTTAKYIDLTEEWKGETQRFPLVQTDPGDEQVSGGGTRRIPEMDLRSLWEEGDGVRAEPGQYPDEARRAGVRTHHQYRKKRRRIPAVNAKSDP